MTADPIPLPTIPPSMRTAIVDAYREGARSYHAIGKHEEEQTLLDRADAFEWGDRQIDWSTEP